MHAPPPIWAGLAFFLMVILNWSQPGPRLLPVPVNFAGLIPGAGGIVLGALATARFKRHGTTLVPGARATKLVTDGPFRFSRNPMYLSLIAALLGVALLFGTLSPLLVVPGFVAVIAIYFVPREERMLEEQFGDEYRRYKRRVRRWI